MTGRMTTEKASSSATELGSISPVAANRKRSYEELGSGKRLTITKRGSCSLAGRKSEDRLVCGVRILDSLDKFVDLDLAIDGHGGSEVATFVAEHLPRALKKLCSERKEQLDFSFRNREEWSKLLREAFQSCNDEWDRSITTPSQLRAGAVATLLLIGDGACMIAHVGDGKVVAHNGVQVSELTKSHRADDPDEKARIESCGGCVFNNRVRGVLAPSRAFGDLLVRTDRNGQVNNDIIRPDPQLVTYPLDGFGCMVLGTDGIFDVLDSQRVALAASLFLSKIPDNDLAARFLAQQASARTDDDVSVIVVSWGQVAK